MGGAGWNTKVYCSSNEEQGKTTMALARLSGVETKTDSNVKLCATIRIQYFFV
jgi:hypothetical protein